MMEFLSHAQLTPRVPLSGTTPRTDFLYRACFEGVDREGSAVRGGPEKRGSGALNAKLSPSEPKNSACPRGTLFSRERRMAMGARCRRWACPPCGRYKASRISARANRLKPDFLMTVSLPRSAWPTLENHRELQMRLRWFLRWCQRHQLVDAYLWVREVGKPRPECVCLKPTEAERRGVDGPQGCQCGANGEQLHRHFVVRVGRGSHRNRFGSWWLPYARLQAAARRCGLGTLDFRQITDAHGAARYVSKYLAKSLHESFAGTRRWASNEPDQAPTASGDWQWSPLRPALVAVEQLGAVAVDWDTDFYRAPANTA